MTPVLDHTPVMLKVDEKIVEHPEFATLFFQYHLSFKPGQFILVWLPGVDEKPYAISYHSKDRFAITIEAKGIFSKKAITLDKGDLVGIRGPFGNGFDVTPGQKTAVVAGGCGMATLATLVETLASDTYFVHGARTKAYILFPDRFEVDRQFCTDDGSFGYKGFVTDLLEKQILSGDRFEMVYTCGPEIMMYTVFQICERHRIPCQAALERYMRCGFGVCGACVCGDQVVCKDGPVFRSEQLRGLKDFNQTALLKSGKEVGLSEYYAWRCP